MSALLFGLVAAHWQHNNRKEHKATHHWTEAALW